MKALEGIVVLDLTHALAGPFCTYQLQLLGAEVIKVERPGHGDDFRDFARPPGWDVGPSFVAVNGGKRSVTANLKDAEGVEIVRRLAGRADIVVENLRPGAADALGVGYEALTAINDRLIYCSISGFGQTGEMSQWPAYDHTIKAMSGMMWNGEEGDVPSQSRGFSVDCFSGYVAYGAILSALVRRERTGRGQRLDVPMLDSALVLSGVGFVRKMITGDDNWASQPVVHRRPTVSPYQTTDGWLWLSVNFQNQWEVLCEVLGMPQWLEDPRFRDVPARNANPQALEEALAARLAGESAEVLETRLMQAGCPAAKVRTSSEALRMDAIRDSGMLMQASVAGVQPVTLINAGFRADEDGPSLSGPVPSLGADTDAVLAELGYAPDAVAGLRARGAV